ncbi:hypothetical protein VTJ49DRAFT_3781 [Mycothermus thermophilus]|uniref:Uncharacterized protein n=1 Tax=Humicola insolens TaxID=85995 RepID=A0ABR3V6N3_HUMIN
MVSTSKDTLHRIRKTLEPYVRPRDEVGRIRQILAAHLDSCLEDGVAVEPLALVDSNGVKSLSTARGLQKEYLEALDANIKAHREFEECCHHFRRVEAESRGTEADRGLDHLKEHLATIQLRQRRDKLEAIEGCLTTLTQKPAASPGFLDPGEVFKDSRPLPDVPKDLVAALGAESTSNRPPLKELIDQLERHVLQAKLLLTREEQLLEQVKARSTARPGSVSDGAKLEALNKTRVELIAWIEAELSKSGENNDDGTSQHTSAHHRQSQTELINMDEQLASIKEKYAQYVDARKTLLRLVSDQPQPVLAPPKPEPTPTASPNPPSTTAPSGPPPPPPPTAHLFSPYLDRLLSTSREQRGLIAHKSHLNATITKQVRENLHVLDRLADESQLLPAHASSSSSSSASAAAGSPTRRDRSASFADPSSGGIAAAADSGTGSGSGPSARVRPWVLAADSAKIATLETVAEKIEEGQMALESTMRTLGEVEELVVVVDRERPVTAAGETPARAAAKKTEEEEEEEEEEEDLWLPPSRRQSVADRRAGVRRHTVASKVEQQKTQQQVKTVWDVLDGSLGLLRADRDNNP